MLSSAPGSAIHSRPNGSRGRKCRFCQGMKAPAPQRPVGDDGGRHEQVHARIWPRRAGQAPPRAEATRYLRQRPGTLSAGILEARRLIDDQHVEQRMVVRDRGELAGEPWHVVDADHRDVARRCFGEQLLPALGAALEHGKAQVCQVRPLGGFVRPYGGRHELGCDDQRVAPMPVADELGERRERGSALAGAERRNQKRGVALIEECRRALLVLPQVAGVMGVFIAAPLSILSSTANALF